MDANSPYLALAEKAFYVYIREEKKQNCKLLQSKDCEIAFTAGTCRNFFLHTCFAKHQIYKREHGLFKEDSRHTRMLCLCCRRNCCFDPCSNKDKFRSRGLTKRTYEDKGEDLKTPESFQGNSKSIMTRWRTPNKES